MLTSPLDYETLSVGAEGIINLVVLATDHGSPPRTGSVNITITVQDINDCTPQFTSSSYTGSVTENEIKGTLVASVDATDCDGSSPNNDVFYLINSGGNDQFRINSTSGDIETVTELDREARAHYSLEVLAVDRGSPSRSSSVIVSVDVLNVNDDKPRFPLVEVTVTREEELRPGSLVYNFSALDGDEDAELHYMLLWNQSRGFRESLPVPQNVLEEAFHINNATGMITVNQRLDREKLDTATIIVVVEDLKASDSTQTATGTLTIQVQDIDDKPPQFSTASFTASVDENSPAGTPLQLDEQITVKDADKDANSRFTLSLSHYSDCLTVIPDKAGTQATVLIQVKNKTCFDYEKIESMDFKLIATPEVNTNNTREAAVHLNIINKNDETPQFTQDVYAVNISENATLNTLVITVNATDADKPEYNQILYSLQGGDDMFSIDNITGEVRVSKADLDYETRQQYQVTVEVTDRGGLRDTATLTITVLDVNDNTPRFVRPEYQAFVVEGVDHFVQETNVTATDLDEGVNKEIRYSISPTSQLAGNFSINDITGRLGVKGSTGLDFEALPDTASGQVHLVTVACDRGSPTRCSNVSVIVTVRDENDNTPAFLQSYHGNMSESAPLNAPLLTVNATDGDGHTPNNKVFYVMSGSGSDKFKVDSSSGLITRAGQLNSDTQSFYNLTISAIDGGSPPKSSSTFVTVDILDVNDEAPTFNPTSRTISVNESNEMSASDSGRVLMTLWATDPDQDSDLSYDLVLSESQAFGPNQEILDVSVLQNVLEVNSSSGEIKVHTSLDRETLSRAVLVVNVTDLKAVGTPQNSTGQLTMTVLDVNDHKPRFNQNSYVAQIQENAVKDNVLNIVSADQMNVTDLDTDQNCVFSVTVDGTENEYFTAEPSTARSFALVQLRVRNGTMLDYEKRRNITFNVTATETSTADHFSDTITVTLNLIDVNDNAPVFDHKNYSISVQENSPARTNITRITATDKDSGSFGEVTYSLEGDAARFTINSITGDIMTADNRLDRESRDTYLMTVVATDGGGIRTGAQLKITITDDNDVSPRFQSNYSSKVRENDLHLTPPVVLLAKDNDLVNTANSNVTYHLHTCQHAPCSNFSLDMTRGRLTLNTPLDFEKTRSVQLLVLARDQGTPQLTGTTTVSIEVEDVNDVDPGFTMDLYHATVYENAEEGTNVSSVSANDGDGTSPNNVVFYVLDSGRGSDKFQVNSTTGVVTVGPGASLNRETGDTFELGLLALDRGDPPRSSTATLSVTLLDINDEKPVFEEERKTSRVQEDADEGYVVEVMNATDPDEHSDLVYTWLLEESQATTDRDVPVNITWISTWFSVNSSTGAVTVGSQMDRELAEVVVMKIMVNDTTGVDKLPQTALATLTITLSDVNDNAPVISGSNSLLVSEALAVETEVASFSARDADRDQTATFSLLAEGVAYFNISSAGKISLQRQIDREKTPTVNFTVIATDSGSPPLSSNITITVTVLDANDNDPQFQNTSYVFSVPEDAPEHTVVVIINATDADQGPNANVTFDFADNVYDFVINKTTGEILVHKPLNREERPSYSFLMAALDNPTTDVKRRTTQQITIHISDVNDNAPQFTNVDPVQHSYTAQIDETKGPGDKVLNIQPGPVQASDQDQGSNADLTFFLTSQDAVDYFRIDELNGELFVNESILGEAGKYNYTVTVMDGGQPPMNATANLTIEVKDQNLNDPQFVGHYTNLAPISECMVVGHSIVTLVATDSDRDKESNGKVQYFFDNTTSRPADLSYFSLDPDTGLLTSAHTFNREQQSQFQIGIIAQDKGVPNIRYSKPLRLIINISDGNDNPPKFKNPQYSFTVYEGRTVPNVGQVYAEDQDDYKRTCYTLEGDQVSHFNITSHTDRPANLQLIEPLDREDSQQASFSFKVTATDCTPSVGDCDETFNPVFATVKIKVLDINDNPPNFTSPYLTFGLVSTANVGHVIVDLPEYVRDPDLGTNRVHAFYPVGNYKMDSKLNASLGMGSGSGSPGPLQPLALSVNGTVTTRSALPGDAEGFFTWKIRANDSAGEGTVVIKIYVVGKDKLIKITFFRSVEELRQMQDSIIRDLSAQTGLQFVADDREPFEDAMGIDSSKSVLVVHAVDKKEEAMDANSLMDFLDHEVDATNYMKNRYKLYNIQTYKEAEAKAQENMKKMEYILGAIICVLVIAFLITLYLMLNNIRRFKRKLKAATIETYPMAGKELQNTYPGQKTPQTNPIFGKDEEDLATKEVDVDNMSNGSDDSLDNNSVDFDGPSLTKEDEQEVTLDLYGEDTEPPTERRDQFYLDQALAEHERLKQRTPEFHLNGLGSVQKDAVNGYTMHGLDFDLDRCESSDI